MAAGDTGYVSSAHAATEAAAITFTFPGTATSPNNIYSINAATGAISRGAKETTTGNFSSNINGTFYMLGCDFDFATGAVNPVQRLNNTTGKQTYNDCRFAIVATGSTARLIVGSQTGGIWTETTFINCQWKFGAAGQVIEYAGKIKFIGGSELAGGSDPTNFLSPISSARQNADININGFDFSTYAATLNLCKGGVVDQTGTTVFNNCKLPASWTGGLVSTALTTIGLSVEAYNCSDDSKNYRLWTENYSGSVKEETSIVLTGGATDGVTPYSWKMAANANVEPWAIPLISPPMVFRNETTGSALTLTVEVTHSFAAALTDKDIYLEIESLNSASFPISTFANDGPATPITTPVDQATSTEAWGGAAQTFKQVLSVSVTPNMKGDIVGRVVLQKEGTCYVNPDLIVGGVKHSKVYVTGAGIFRAESAAGGGGIRLAGHGGLVA